MDDEDERVEAYLSYLREKIPPEDCYELIGKLVWTVKLICEEGLDDAIEKEFVFETCVMIKELIEPKYLIE